MPYYKSVDGSVNEFVNFVPADSVRLTNAEGKAAMQEQAKAELRKILKPGQTVYCILNHVSSSGMSRSISLAIGGAKGEIRKLDYLVARANGEHIDDKHGGLKVSGCGMDMGFHLVYNLGSMLWPNGTKKPHGSRNGAPDRDGGYALKSTWL